MTPYLTFGEWLQRRRLSLGLTQAELGRRVGFAAETIRKVEADRRRPSPQMVEQLADALEIEPSDRAIFLQFARDEGDPDIALTSQSPALPDWSTPPHYDGLPAQTTSFIGRERELELIRHLMLREEVRLITLTGSGGTGKTRLALEVAYATRSDAVLFPDGVYFVNLAPITDPSLVASTIMQTLNVREKGGRLLLDRLKDYLQQKRLLLVLDNFEQVVKAAPLVVDLLACAPRLKVLVTSRETLRLRGEYDFAVPPLPLPERPLTDNGVRSLRLGRRRVTDDETQYTDYAVRIRHNPAVVLFVERAEAAKADFVLTNQNAVAVSEICRRLDGLPLAIELAAVYIKALTPQVLLKRLERRLLVLVDGARDLPTRQQTLRNTIAWSYDLLGEGEKALFRRLAVFVGGFTLEAAEATCSNQSRPRTNETEAPTTDVRPGFDKAAGHAFVLHRDDVLDRLISLVKKSLVKQEDSPEGEPRYVMLETVREYALERLVECREMEMSVRHYAHYFLALSEEAAPKLKGPEQLIWYKRLETEHDNLRAALDWAQKSSEPEIWLRLTWAISEFWLRRSFYDEARYWLEQAVEQASTVSPLLTSRVLAALGRVALSQRDQASAITWLKASIAGWPSAEDEAGLVSAMNGLASALLGQGDYAAARALAEEALAMALIVGDEWTTAGSIRLLGHLAGRDGNYERARKLYDEAQTLYREIGDKDSVVSVLDNLAYVASLQGDDNQWRQLIEEGLAEAREQDNKLGMARALNGLGEAARCVGDYEHAAQFYADALEISRKLRHRSMTASLLHNLGHVSHYQGDFAQAEKLFYESLAFRLETNDTVRILVCIAALAGVWGGRGQPERACRLLGAVEEQLGYLQVRLDPADLIEFDRNVTVVRKQLAENVFEAIWVEGATMTLAQIVNDVRPP